MSFVAVAIGGGAILGLGGALIGANASQNAASTQANAANYAANLQSQDAQKALDFQKQVYGNQQQEEAPFLNSGYGALANLNSLLGLPNSNTPLFNPGAPTSTSTNVPNSIPYEGDPNVPQYIPGPHGSDMPNPAYGAQQQRSTITAAPSGTPSKLQTLGDLVNPSLGAPGSLSQGWTGTFQPPTNVTEQNDPGYQFRLQTGLNAMQNSAAARGGALTQGTAQDLNSYAQGDASNEYQNVYNRAYNNYTTGYNQFEQQQANTYNRLASMAGIGQISAQQLGQSGQAAAGTNANILLTSGQQIGQNINNAGAARASGYVGAANAYGGALGNAGNNLTQLGFLNQMLNGGGGGYGAGGNPFYQSYAPGATNSITTSSVGDTIQ